MTLGLDLDARSFDPAAVRAAICFAARVIGGAVAMRGILLFAGCLLMAAGPALFAQKADRHKPPTLGPAPSLKLPPVQHLKLSNGLPVVLMEKHDVPLVQMELIVMSGAAMDPPELSGLADITAAMLEEGAGSRNSLQLADAIDVLGISLSGFAGQHTSGVVLHTPLSKLDSALALFGDMVLRPTFPGEELARIRTERLTTLAQWRDDPGQIAGILLNRTLFGPDHPYGRPSLGTEKSLRAIGVDDLKKFHRKFFRPNNASLHVVGDLTASSVLPKLEEIFHKWEKGDINRPDFPVAEQVKSRGIYLVDKPGAPQSVIRIGRIGAQRVSEDYFPLIVMNTILGGSFSSRLNSNLREQHGYTYGARSGFDFLPKPGAFRALADVQTAVTDSALVEFMNELKRIQEPVSDDELTRAVNYLTLRYPENFQSVSQVAGQLLDLVLYHLPDSYFSEYSGRVRAVTKEDVERVARKYLDPEKVAIVIVGDRKQIEQGIVALNLGPVKDLTVDDVLGAAPAAH